MPKLVKSSADCFVNGVFVPAGKPYTTTQYDSEDAEIPERVTIINEIEEAEFEDVIDDDSLSKDISDTSTANGTGMIEDDKDLPAATDSAKALAKEYSVNLEDVAGTGAKNQITKGDVQKFIADNSQAPTQAEPEGDGEI